MDDVGCQRSNICVCVCQSNVRPYLSTHVMRGKRTSFAADREAEFLFEKGEFGSVAGDLVRKCGALFRFDCGPR